MMQCGKVALILLLAGVATAAAFTPTKDAKSGMLSPSVLLMGEFDWALSTGGDGKPWSRCLDMVWRARSVSKGNRLNFVPTHHWLPREDGFGVSQYCYLHTSGGGDRGTCMSWTPGKLAEFKKSMTLCLAETLRQGFIPYVRPHLDDGLNRGIWRNGLLFGPNDKYGSYSYADVMTIPLAEAMRDALAITAAEGSLNAPADRSRPVVYMGLQGEMSATIMRYTGQWASLVPAIKSIIGNKYADVKVGIGLNFNALSDTEQHPPQNTGFVGFLLGSGQRASRYPVPGIDSRGVDDLISNKIDFVGISAYAPFNGADFGLSEFENSAFNVADSLRSLANVNLAGLVNAGKLELHYSEFGLGGGRNGNAEIASNPTWCAKQPWAGITGPYNPSNDPWKRPDLAAFRREFYRKTMQWLSSPGSRTYQVSDVFVWGMASWDMFGVYPDSSSPSGSYRDPALIPEIGAFNIAVIGAKANALKGPEAAAAAVAALEGGVFNGVISGGSTAVGSKAPAAPVTAPVSAPAPAAPAPVPVPASQPSANDPPEQPVAAPAPAGRSRGWGGLWGLIGR